jgi:preprotein translocase subunit SecD
MILEPRWKTPARWLVGLTVVALLAGACGSESSIGSESTPATSASTTDAAAETTSGSESTLGSESTSATSASTTDPSSSAPGLDPDLAEACTAEPFTTDGGGGASPPAADPVVLIDRNGSRLCLGPVVLEGRIVESAAASPADLGGYWIELVLTPDGIDQFNQIAALCYTEAPDPQVCPQRQLAFVNGTTIASAPVIHSASFERDQIIVSGNFNELEASGLASAFVEDGMVLRPVLADLGP